MLWCAFLFSGVSAIDCSCLQFRLAKVESAHPSFGRFRWSNYSDVDQRRGAEMAREWCPYHLPAPSYQRRVQGRESQVGNELQLCQRLWVCCHLRCRFPALPWFLEKNSSPFQGIFDPSIELTDFVSWGVLKSNYVHCYFVWKAFELVDLEIYIFLYFLMILSFSVLNWKFWGKFWFLGHHLPFCYTGSFPGA